MVINKIKTNSKFVFEKLSGTDFEYAFKNGSWVFLKQVLVTTAGLFLTYYFTHNASKESYGTYNLTLSTFNIALALSLPGALGAVMRAVARGFYGTPHMLLKLRFIFSFIGSCFLLALSFYYIKTFQDTLALITVGLSFFIFFINPLSLYEGVLTGQKKFKTKSILTSIYSVLGSLIVLATIYFKIEIIYLIYVLFIFYSCTNLIFYIFSNRYLTNSRVDKDWKSYSLTMSAVGGISLVGANMDKFILGNMLGFIPLAIYSAANVIIDGVSQNLKTFFEIFTIKLANNPADKNKDILKRLYLRLLLIGFIISFFVYTLTPVVGIYLFSEAYSDSIKLAQILSVLFIFYPLSLLLSTAVVFKGDPKENFAYNLLSQFIKILLFFILIPQFGIFGVLYSLISEKLISFIFLNYLVFK